MLVPFLLVWIAALTLSPVRQAYLNGWRCLCRHSVLWKIPVWFSLAYGLFQLADYLLIAWRMETVPSPGIWAPPSETITVAIASLLPATESLAANFNCLVATFPISAPAALLLIFNYRGLTAELARALAKVFGWKGWLLFLLLVLCAICALAKPLLLLALPELMERVPFVQLMVGATAANALSFAFEYLLGTSLQIYLLLVAFGWVRGSEFDPERLMRFAVRRLGFVFKWSIVIIATTLAILHQPMLAGFLFTGVPAPAETEGLARLILAVLMLVLGGVQIQLVLHNETLGHAIAAHLRFWRRQGFALTIFLLTAFTFILPWKILETAGFDGFGESLLGQVAIILTQVICAIFGGWILASWVCFYKSCQSKKLEIAF